MAGGESRRRRDFVRREREVGLRMRSRRKGWCERGLSETWLRPRRTRWRVTVEEKEVEDRLRK
jgi:hypothetical protein